MRPFTSPSPTLEVSLPQTHLLPGSGASSPRGVGFEGWSGTQAGPMPSPRAPTRVQGSGLSSTGPPSSAPHAPGQEDEWELAEWAERGEGLCRGARAKFGLQRGHGWVPSWGKGSGSEGSERLTRPPWSAGATPLSLVSR